jgi:geranylgeranyl reductase family protein
VSSSPSTDVLVVGGGPAGCSAAIRLANAGHKVTVLEGRSASWLIPRGDLLVPAAVGELQSLGIDAASFASHRILGTRMCHGARAVAVPWPSSAPHTEPGVVAPRIELDATLREHARSAGATVHLGARATSPIVDRGFVRGASVDWADGSTSDLSCRFLVVADGANSRFGRGLGTNRDRRWPYAISASTYVTSERSSDQWIETHLGPLDASGHPVTGHGWVHPVGDGRLNVGVTVLSSYRDVLAVNIVKLLDAFAESVAASWQFDPAKQLVAPARWRTPVGGSVGPKMGPTFLVVGDAAGLANPFTSHGVRAALATGRIAADVLDEALRVGNSTTLQRYPARLDEAMGQYHKVGRLTARFLGRPWLLQQALRSGVRSEAAMGAALRIATNELRDGESGGAERAYRLASIIARFAPSW